MPVTRALPQLPDPSTPIVDANGRMNREWYAYFSALRAVLDAMRVAIP